MAGRFERFTQAVVERFRPEIRTGTLENFIEIARLAGTKNVLAEIGDRKVPVQPEEQERLPRGYEEWEYYTKFTAKGLSGKKITFTQTNGIYALPRVDPPPYVQIIFNSILKTEETRRKLLKEGLKVTVQRRGIAYSEDEFAQLVGKARLIGSFVGY